MTNEAVRPTLTIKLNVNCPECDYLFDMVEETNLNEEGWLLNKLLPESEWANAHDNFECSVICPKCSVEFDVKGVNW